MSWGMRVFDASGNSILNTGDEISRIVYTGYHGPSGTVTLPDYVSTKGFAYFTCDVPYATYYYTFDDGTKAFSWSVTDSSNASIVVVMVR